MNEIIFLIEDAPEGGYIARALDASVFTEADNINDLHDKVREWDSVNVGLEQHQFNLPTYAPTRPGVQTHEQSVCK